jgi:RNA polymerase sigma-70 factor (ECF subfamily)
MRYVSILFLALCQKFIVPYDIQYTGAPDPTQHIMEAHIMIRPIFGAKRLAKPPPIDDAVLVRAARHTPEAFAAIYERYLPNVYRYTLSRVGNVQDAEDLTTQTFIAAMTGLKTYNAKSAVLTWLLGIARHKIADFFRQGKEPMLSLDQAPDLPANHPSPEVAAQQAWQIAQVAAGIATLSPDRAEALTLRLFGGLSVPEIAELMDRSEDAVYALMSRGMRDLRQWLQDNEEGEQDNVPMDS